LELGRKVGFDEKKVLIVIRKLAKSRLYKAGLNRETDRLKRDSSRRLYVFSPEGVRVRLYVFIKG
jgi:hypothetical protein